MRHQISEKKVTLKEKSEAFLLDEAESLELEGNYYLASQKYIELAKFISNREPLSAAILYSRAASWLEVLNQNRDSGKYYVASASILVKINGYEQTSGELFNRAANQLKLTNDFWRAADYYTRAAKAFESCSFETISSRDVLPPVPASAAKLTVAADCLSAAGEACIIADQIPWAKTHFWNAGNLFRKQGLFNSASEEYKKSLVNFIRFQKTLDLDRLRSGLPFTEDERLRKVDPIQILEDSVLKSYSDHQQRNKTVYPLEWVIEKTNERMSSVYTDFSLELEKCGNIDESRNFMQKANRLKSMSLHIKQTHEVVKKLDFDSVSSSTNHTENDLKLESAVIDNESVVIKPMLSFGKSKKTTIQGKYYTEPEVKKVRDPLDRMIAHRLRDALTQSTMPIAFYFTRTLASDISYPLVQLIQNPPTLGNSTVDEAELIQRMSLSLVKPSILEVANAPSSPVGKSWLDWILIGFQNCTSECKRAIDLYGNRGPHEIVAQFEELTRHLPLQVNYIHDMLSQSKLIDSHADTSKSEIHFEATIKLVLRAQRAWLKFLENWQNLPEY